MINKQPYSYEVDIWSLGVIMYTLIFGKPPFESNDEKIIYKKIKKLEYTFPEDIKVTEEAKDLIRKILVLDPRKRLKLDQILIQSFFKSCKDVPKLLPPSIESNNNNNLKTNNEFEKYRNTIFEEDETLKKPSIWVKCWLDFSSKYGLGYVFNNLNYGVFFNDSTKIILNPQTNIFFYIDEKEEYNKYDFNDYPKEIKNKILLLNHFKNFLEGKIKEDNLKTSLEHENDKKYEEIIKKENEEENKNKIKNEEEKKEKPFFYVKSWMRTKHIIILRFINGTLQFIFSDNSEIFFSDGMKIVTYVSRKRERITFSFYAALICFDSEINKRLKYIKDLIFFMKNNPIYGCGFFNIFDKKIENYDGNGNDKEEDINKKQSDQKEVKKEDGNKKKEKDEK